MDFGAAFSQETDENEGNDFLEFQGFFTYKNYGNICVLLKSLGKKVVPAFFSNILGFRIFDVNAIADGVFL